MDIPEISPLIFKRRQLLADRNLVPLYSKPFKVVNTLIAALTPFRAISFENIFISRKINIKKKKKKKNSYTNSRLSCPRT